MAKYESWEDAQEFIKKDFSSQTKEIFGEEWKDYEFVMQQVQEFGMNLRYASEELKNDRRIVLAAIKQDVNAIEYMPAKFKNDREIIFESVRQNGNALQNASETLKNDKEIVFEAVKRNPEALEYASRELRGDRYIVVTACDKDFDAWKYVSEDIKYDIMLIDDISNKNEEASIALERLKLDKDFMTKAVQKNWFAITYASDKLKEDKEFIQTAVDKYGAEMLGEASPKLQGDYFFMQEQITKEPYAFKYASPVLKNDDMLAGIAVSRDARMFLQVSDRLKDSNNLMASAFNNASNTFNREYLLNNTPKDLLMKVIDNPLVRLENIIPHLLDVRKNDIDIITKAVKRDGRMLEFASEDLKNNEQIIDMATEQDYKNIRFIGEETKQEMQNIKSAKKVVWSDETKQRWQNYQQMYDMNATIERYKTDDTMKLKDIKGDYFTNPTFYNDVVNAMRDKVMIQFNQMTQGLQTDEVIDERLQQKLQERLQDVQAKLERRKNFAMMKSTIKQYFKASSVSSKISHIEV